MVLAHLCGRSVAPLLFPGARKIAEDRVALVGARALDSGERANLDRSRVLRIAFDREHADAPGLIAWARRRPIWCHIDVDVVDPSEMPAVAFAAIGGPTLAALGEVSRQLFSVADVRGLSLCGYDARADRERRYLAPLVGAMASAMGRIPVRA
jgi:arginase